MSAKSKTRKIDQDPNAQLRAKLEKMSVEDLRQILYFIQAIKQGNRNRQGTTK